MLNTSAELFLEMRQVLIYFIIRKKWWTDILQNYTIFWESYTCIYKENVITIYVWKVDFKWFFSLVDIIKED